MLGSGFYLDWPGTAYILDWGQCLLDIMWYDTEDGYFDSINQGSMCRTYESLIKSQCMHLHLIPWYWCLPVYTPIFFIKFTCKCLYYIGFRICTNSISWDKKELSLIGFEFPGRYQNSKHWSNLFIKRVWSLNFHVISIYAIPKIMHMFTWCKISLYQIQIAVCPKKYACVFIAVKLQLLFYLCDIIYSFLRVF